MRYRQSSIADVLDMTVTQACEFLENIPKVRQKLETLREVGLGYIKLGQSATTLSGGEAQRIKLSKELAKKSSGRTVYILDEPTTGLHFADIAQLLSVLNRLVEAGNTVIVIEHNLDVIKTADWVIDLGPEGGPGGGQVVAQGTPDDVARVAASFTGQFLRKKVLSREARVWAILGLLSIGPLHRLARPNTLDAIPDAFWTEIRRSLLLRPPASTMRPVCEGAARPGPRR